MEIFETLLAADPESDLAQAAQLARMAVEIGYPLWQLDPTGVNSAWLGILSQQIFLIDPADSFATQRQHRAAQQICLLKVCNSEKRDR